MLRYAFLVKLNKDILQVINIIEIDDEDRLSPFERWKTGFAVGDVSLIIDKSIDKVSIGSFWDGKKLIFKEGTEIVYDYDNERSGLVLSKNFVFGAIGFNLNKDIKERFLNAANKKIIGIDVSNIENVEVGSFWDGKKFFKDE